MMSRILMSPFLLHCTLRLKPCIYPQDLMTDGISQVSSVNPDHRFLLLEDFLGWLSVPSQDLLSKPVLATLARTFPDPNLLDLFQRYHEGVIPLNIFHSGSLRGICTHPSRSTFNNFSSVESFRLCALLQQ
jgi:hypothetical protein